MTDSRNDKTVTIKMTRHELCRTLVLLASVINKDGVGKVYCTIHEKLKKQLEDFDKRWEEKHDGKH